MSAAFSQLGVQGGMVKARKQTVSEQSTLQLGGERPPTSLKPPPGAQRSRTAVVQGSTRSCGQSHGGRSQMGPRLRTPSRKLTCTSDGPREGSSPLTPQTLGQRESSGQGVLRALSEMPAAVSAQHGRLPADSAVGESASDCFGGLGNFRCF